MNITTLKTVTKAYIYRGSVHLIAYAPQVKQYVAIDRALIGPDGHLIRELNGIEMHMDPDVNTVMQRVRDKIDIEKMMAHGMTKAQAICEVMHLDYTPELESILV